MALSNKIARVDVVPWQWGLGISGRFLSAPYEALMGLCTIFQGWTGF